MKGTVYTGVIYFPRHPDADMHGLIRCVVRTSGLMNLAGALRVYDIPFHAMMFGQGIWCESKSIAEIEASEMHYGEVMVCPTWCQYLKAENYKTIPRGLKCQKSA